MKQTKDIKLNIIEKFIDWAENQGIGLVPDSHCEKCDGGEFDWDGIKRSAKGYVLGDLEDEIEDAIKPFKKDSTPDLRDDLNEADGYLCDAQRAINNAFDKIN